MKDFMIKDLDRIIKILEEDYRKYFDTERFTYSGSGCMRARVNKELQIAKLIQYLLRRIPDDITFPEDILDAYNLFTKRFERR